MGMGTEQRLYGELLTEFANADSTDEASQKYFENVQKIFHFSDQFASHARSNFHTKEKFRALLSDSEKKCLDLILKKNDIERLLSSPLSGDHLEYDIHSKKIHFQQLKSQSLDGPWIEDSEYTSKTWSLKEFRNIIFSDHANPDFKFEEEEADKLLAALKNLSEQIRAFQDVSSKRYHEILKLIPQYRYVMFYHDFIEKRQSDLHTLLDSIVREGSVNRSPILDEIIDKYNRIPRSSVYLTSAGLIDEEPPFNEDLFLKPDDDENLLIYDGPISYCIINFLIDSNCIPYLKKCRFCHNFFIAKDLRRQFCNEPKDCKEKFNNKDRARRMKEEYRNPDSKKFKVDYLR